MNTKILLTVFLLLYVAPVLSMNNYDDPRELLSYMDQSLVPELDILRVTTKISPQNNLIFQVKMRGESAHAKKNTYTLLQITHGDTYGLLIPINKNHKAPILMLKQASNSKKDNRTGLARKFIKQPAPKAFSADRINQGVNFSLPIDWINFGDTIGYDAYTVQARLAGNTVYIEKTYDRAGKGRKTAKQFSAITLMNTLCATRRK